MWDDEETSEERVAVSASFADPYLVIVRDDASLLLLQVDESGDLDEMSLPNEITSLTWRSACLYRDKTRAFAVTEPTSHNDTLMFSLDVEYKLSVGWPAMTI